MDLGDPLKPGGCSQSFPFVFRNADFCEFKVGGVISFRRTHYYVFPGVGSHHELMRETSADVSRIGSNHAEREPASFKYTYISIVHCLVGAIRFLIRNIEAIGIFHYEFTCSHNSEPGTNFIPEFRLYLVKIDGKLFVGTNFLPNYVRYYFLVCGPQTEIPFSSILEAEQFFSVVIPPGAFNPRLSRKHRGHEKFYGSGPVHFFPHYVLDFSYGPESQRKIVVDPGRKLSYHAGSYHKLVTYDLGIRGVFFDRGYEIGRKPHPFFSFKVI